MSDTSNVTLTQCPHCDTVFQVSDEQLQVAQGRVRCGRCQGVFDALVHPYEQVDEHADGAQQEPLANAQTWESDEPDDTPYIIASRDDDSWTPQESELPDDADAVTENPGVAVAQDAVEVAVTAPETSAAESGASEPTEAVPEKTPTDTLVETLPPIDIVEVLRDQLGADAPPPAKARSIAWPLLAVLLMLSLAGQYLFFARADLAQYDLLRPWLQRACTYLGCELPLRHSPEQIELLSRDVISHPRIRNALLVSASFVNRASFAQVYPVLQISLSNESGTVVAMRRFQPEEYLAQGARIAAGMVPDAPVRVVLEVAEPKQGATSFQFEFL